MLNSTSEYNDDFYIQDKTQISFNNKPDDCIIEINDTIITNEKFYETVLYLTYEDFYKNCPV
jgi:hypothetical protein